MPIKLTPDSEIDLGEVYIEWDVPEYKKHKRPRRWYIVMSSIALAMILFGVLSQNFLFALIIVLAMMIFYMQHNQEPPQVQCMITELGVVLGNRFYTYDELTEFYIIYDPPAVKMLFIETKVLFRPFLAIDIDGMNPLDVQRYLRANLIENIEKEEPLTEQVVREWRIQ